MRISKKILAILMAALMIVSVMPLTALADVNEATGSGGQAQGESGLDDEDEGNVTGGSGGGAIGGPGIGGPGDIWGTGGDPVGGVPGTAGNGVPTFPATNSVVRLVNLGKGAYYYISLEDAIADAEEGAVITAIADIVATEPIVIPAGADIQIDLNGHSISGNITDSSKKLIQVFGKVEFVGGSGCIYNTNTTAQGHAACQARTGGTIIVNAPVTFGDSDTDRTNANTVNRGCGIQNNGGTLIINDGYYTAVDANYSTGAWAYAILNCEGNTTVNNATVYGNNLHGALGCEDGTFTVNGGNFTVAGANNYYSLYCDGGKFIVNGGTFNDSSSHGVNYVGANSETVITGGDFTYSETTPFVQSGSASNPVVSGGSYSRAVPAACLADGCTQDANGVVAQTNVAKIGETYYETLNAAISAATAGNTITVLADTTLTTTDVNINKNITIDFGKYTVTAARWPFINNAILTLTGTTGGLVSSRGVIDNYGTLTVNGGVYTSTPTVQPAIYNNPGAETIINGGTINSNNAAVYNEGATVTINGGVLNSGSSSKANSVYYSYCVRNLPGSTCTMNGGTINAVHGGIAAYGNGVDDTTVVVNDGTITTHHSELGNDAHYPLYISGNGTSMTVNGGTFSGPRTAAMIDDDDIGLTENTSLTITGGTFIAPTGVAAVTRGDNDSYPAISGGYFSTRVPGEFCADGYAAKVDPDANGYYTVGATNDGANITVADEISQNFYLDDDFYGEDAYVAVTYNTNTNVEESATIGTEIKAMSSLPVLSTGSTYDGNRIISITQAPAQVTENVEINVYASQADAQAGTNAVKTLTYSTYDYCTTILDTPNAELGEKATELKELAEATLDYAAAAQTYFNYNTDNMATADNAGNDFYNDVAGTVFDDVFTPNFGGLFTNATVVVKSDLEINLLTKKSFSYDYNYYNPSKGGDRFGVSTYVNGSYNVLHIKGIEPANMDEVITLYTSYGYVEITANSIMKIMAKSSNTNMATLAKAMYRYGQAANAYFD